MLSIYHYFLCFVIYSFLGWLYESSFYTIQHHRLVNSGFLQGCICPIYGAGALLSLMLLGEVENSALLFVMAIVICCTLEYFVSWLLEEMFDTRWWDYTNWPLNINGRVCIYGAAAFGVLVVALIKYIHPFISEMMLGISLVKAQVLTAIIALIILADMIYTLRHTDTLSAKLWFVKEQPKLFEDEGPGLLGKNKAIVESKLASMREVGLREFRIIKSIPNRLPAPKNPKLIQKLREYLNR